MDKMANTLSPLVIFSISKQISHIFFCLSNKFAEHFRPIYNLNDFQRNQQAFNI